MVIKFIKGSPKIPPLDKKHATKAPSRGGNIASNTTPKKLLDHWSKMRRVPPELSDTTIHYFHSFLLTFWKRFHDVPCVKGFQNGMLFITSSPMNYTVFLRFLPTNPNWLVTHQLHRPWSHQTIGAHARQCATALGACWGWSSFFFWRSNHQSWQMILNSFNIFHHFSFVILFFFLRRFCVETFLTQYVESIKTTTWRIFHLPKSPNAWWVPTNPTQQLGPVQIPMINFD